MFKQPITQNPQKILKCKICLESISDIAQQQTKQNAVLGIIITLFRLSQHVEYQHDSFESDTGSIASEPPSEQEKTKELKDKPEMLQKQKLWLLVNKRLQSQGKKKKSQKALSAESIQRYLANISFHHSPTRAKSGKAFLENFIGKKNTCDIMILPTLILGFCFKKDEIIVHLPFFMTRFYFILVFLFLFRAAPIAHGSSQARS